MRRVKNHTKQNERKAVKGTEREKLQRMLTGKSKGIDGLLVTVGLCIIALLLCVVMKDKLEIFIGTVIDSLTQKAIQILG